MRARGVGVAALQLFAGGGNDESTRIQGHQFTPVCQSVSTDATGLPAVSAFRHGLDLEPELMDEDPMDFPGRAVHRESPLWTIVICCHACLPLRR